MISLAILMMAQTVSMPTTTDFGERVVPGSGVHRLAPLPRAQPIAAPISITPDRVGGPDYSLSDAVRIARSLGRVTSTLRSVAHNRAVGGVPNSYHLRGRAIDIVRAPGVSHQALAATFRHAGFQLVESLDEGDHSHVAFTWGRARRSLPIDVAAVRHTEVAEVLGWKWVSAPGARGR